MRNNLQQNDLLNPKVVEMIEIMKKREKTGRYVKVDEKTWIFCKKNEDPKKKIKEYQKKLEMCFKRRIKNGKTHL